MKDNEAKATIMRKRSVIKKNTNGQCWLTDDVTKLNALLINRLLNHPEIENAWYFNGSVYGETDGTRMKFELFDNIDEKIKNKKKDD